MDLPFYKHIQVLHFINRIVVSLVEMLDVQVLTWAKISLLSGNLYRITQGRSCLWQFNKCLYTSLLIEVIELPSSLPARIASTLPGRDTVTQASLPYSAGAANKP